MTFFHEARLHNLRAIHPRRKVQVAVPKDWHAYASEYRLTRSWQPVNPARYLNAVFCPDQNTIFAVTHLTNGAWNQKKKIGKKLRRKLWLKQERELRQHVERWRELGWNVVIAGDMNRYSAPFLAEGQRVVSEEYMHIICIPADGYEVRIRDERVRFKVHSDHPQVSADVRFVKA